MKNGVPGGINPLFIQPFERSMRWESMRAVRDNKTQTTSDWTPNRSRNSTRERERITSHDLSINLPVFLQLTSPQGLPSANKELKKVIKAWKLLKICYKIVFCGWNGWNLKQAVLHHRRPVCVSFPREIPRRHFPAEKPAALDHAVCWRN